MSIFYPYRFESNPSWVRFYDEKDFRHYQLRLQPETYLLYGAGLYHYTKRINGGEVDWSAICVGGDVIAAFPREQEWELLYWWNEREED